jgi:hypothetical protein
VTSAELDFLAAEHSRVGRLNLPDDLKAGHQVEYRQTHPGCLAGSSQQPQVSGFWASTMAIDR